MTQSSSQTSSDLPSSFIKPVVDYFHSCQKNIVTALSMIDGSSMHQRFNPSGVTHSIENGRLFERAGLSFFYTQDSAIPANRLSPRRQYLAGSRLEQTGIILALHPKNPYIPSVSMHLHCTILFPKQQQPVGWFSTSMDLTPFYGFEEDAVHFHQICKTLLDPFGRYRYPLYKAACDQHFFIAHRKEPRGIGGIFYDDIHDADFETQFQMTQAVGNHFLEAYIPIVEKRKIKPYSERERAFQAYRRGRYVEFNLVYDRGTRWGLHSEHSAESVLMSMPPMASWCHEWSHEKDSPEDHLYRYFLTEHDWLGQKAMAIHPAI